MNQELFESELIHERKTRSRLYYIALTFLIFTSITAVYNFLNTYKLYKAYLSFPQFVPRDVKIHSIASTIFLLLYGIMIPLQAYFFYRLASTLNSSFQDNGDPTERRLDVNWLQKQGVAAVILFGINAVWAIVDLLFFY